MAEVKNQTQEFDEIGSLRVIQEMIRVSRRRLENNGILFIIWGWIMFISYIKDFVVNRIVTTVSLRSALAYVGSALMIIGILCTIYFVFIKKKKMTSHIDLSLRYVWLSLAASLVLINLIIFRQTGTVDFSLQNTIFMVVIASAIVVSGGILRYKLLIVGGIIFALMAYACSFLKWQDQLIVEALAYLVAFIIPGHILYRKRRK